MFVYPEVGNEGITFNISYSYVDPIAYFLSNYCLFLLWFWLGQGGSCVARCSMRAQHLTIIIIKHLHRQNQQERKSESKGDIPQTTYGYSSLLSDEMSCIIALWSLFLIARRRIGDNEWIGQCPLILTTVSVHVLYYVQNNKDNVSLLFCGSNSSKTYSHKTNPAGETHTLTHWGGQGRKRNQDSDREQSEFLSICI